LLVLERTHGHDRVVALARGLYARSTPSDLRELVHERRNPMAAVFEETVGVSLDDFLVDWNAELDRMRELPEVAAVLAGIPEATGKLTIERDVGAIRNAVVHFELVSSPSVSQSQTRGVVVSLLHRDLTPFDEPLERHDLRREERLVRLDEQATDLEILGRYGPGMRIFVALEMQSEVLGCPVRLLAERRAIQ
jgi:hypothetical protein